MKTLIVYSSRKGHTRRFAEEIARRVEKVNGQVTVRSIQEVTETEILECDLLFIGGRMAGSYFLGSKPDAGLRAFLRQMPESNEKRTVLFTTHDFMAGRFFRQMKAMLEPKGYHISGSMKSSNGHLNYFSMGVLRYSLLAFPITMERTIGPLAEVS